MAAAGFVGHHGYIVFVLHGVVDHPHVSISHVEGYDYLYAGGATLGAIALAALGLFGAPLRRMPEAVITPALTALGGLRRLYSGHTGDYIAWWTAGAGLLGGASLIFLR